MRHVVLALALLLPFSLALAPRPAPQADPAGGIATLWARDAVGASFGLDAGGPAARVVQGEVILAGAQLVYGAFAEDRLSYGFDDAELVEVLDLGELVVAPRTRAADATLEYPIPVFETLRLDRGRFVVQDAEGQERRLRDADRLLGTLPDDGLRHLVPVPGHTLLLRTRTRSGSRRDRVAKLLVLAARPGESLTLRWALVAEL